MTEDLDAVIGTVAGVPSGCIVLWHGLLSQIPTGWVLCDGASGTPDLAAQGHDTVNHEPPCYALAFIMKL